MQGKNTSILHPQQDIEQLKRLLWQNHTTIFGHFTGKSRKKFVFQGFGQEKFKYFKPRPDIQQLTRLLLQFYVTIFGHFKGKSHRNLFLKALGEEKYKYFQPKLGYPPIASKAVGLAMYRKKNFSHERAIL